MLLLVLYLEYRLLVFIGLVCHFTKALHLWYPIRKEEKVDYMYLTPNQTLETNLLRAILATGVNAVQRFLYVYVYVLVCHRALLQTATA